MNVWLAFFFSFVAHVLKCQVCDGWRNTSLWCLVTRMNNIPPVWWCRIRLTILHNGLSLNLVQWMGVSTELIAFIYVQVCAATHVFHRLFSKTNIFQNILYIYSIDVIPTWTDVKDVYQSHWFECYHLHEIYACSKAPGASLAEICCQSNLLRGRMYMLNPSDRATRGKTPTLRLQAHILITNGWNSLKLIHDQTQIKFLI